MLFVDSALFCVIKQHCQHSSLFTSVLCCVINTPVTFVDWYTLLRHQHSSYLCWQVHIAMSSTLLLHLLTGVLCYVINTPVTFVDRCTLLCHQHSSYLCWQVYFAMSSTLQLPLLTGVLCYVVNTPVTFVDRCTLLCRQHSSYLCWQVHFAVFSAEEWDLPNPADRYDKIPEIFKGKNVADFVDPDIDKVDWCCEHLPRKYWHSAWKFLQGWLIFGVYGSGLRLWYSFCFLASFGGFW